MGDALQGSRQLRHHHFRLALSRASLCTSWNLNGSITQQVVQQRVGRTTCWLHVGVWHRMERFAAPLKCKLRAASCLCPPSFTGSEAWPEGVPRDGAVFLALMRWSVARHPRAGALRSAAALSVLFSVPTIHPCEQ